MKLSKGQMYKDVTFSAKHIVVTDGLEIQIIYT